MLSDIVHISLDIQAKLEARPSSAAVSSSKNI